CSERLTTEDGTTTYEANSPSSEVDDSQSAGAFLRQKAQSPHGAPPVGTTRSPTFHAVTPRPTASTTPAPSWPKRIGSFPPRGRCPRFQVSVSAPPTSVASSRTRTSPGPGSGIGTS